jgi:hypothetical protein
MLSLYDPTSREVRLELAPGFVVGQTTAPTTLTLTHPGDDPAASIVLTTGPIPSITLGGQPVATAAQLSSVLTPTSIAAGAGAATQGNGSFALGWGTVAVAPGQLAIGRWNLQNGYPDWPNAYGPDALFIIGNGTDATHRSNAFEVIADGTARFANSLSIGGEATWAKPALDGNGPSLSVGVNSAAVGDCSATLGRVVYALGDLSLAAGGWNWANGLGSVSLGSGNNANGATSFAMGWQNLASGWISTVTGHNSTASGDISFAANTSVGALTLVSSITMELGSTRARTMLISRSM